jgi:hypothetical protein
MPKLLDIRFFYFGVFVLEVGKIKIYQVKLNSRRCSLQRSLTIQICKKIR